MSTPDFRFRQFTVRHDRCAMKVGTDGVLLGAWAPLPASGIVLDVGTGTGLIALMVAQRQPALHVIGIDVDAEAVSQARENVAASPFTSRIQILHQGFEDYVATCTESDKPDTNHLVVEPPSAIVCNPPFFTESLLPPDPARLAARHAQSLPFPTLLKGAARLLPTDGVLSVILPTTALETFRLEAFTHGLVLTRLCYVRTTPAKAPKRVLATFVLHHSTPFALEDTTLVLTEGGIRSAAYTHLTRDFYL